MGHSLPAALTLANHTPNEGKERKKRVDERRGDAQRGEGQEGKRWEKKGREGDGKERGTETSLLSLKINLNWILYIQ